MAATVGRALDLEALGLKATEPWQDTMRIFESLSAAFMATFGAIFFKFESQRNARDI